MINLNQFRIAAVLASAGRDGSCARGFLVLVSAIPRMQENWRRCSRVARKCWRNGR